MTRRPARDGEPQPPWCSGACRLATGLVVSGQPLVLAVRCRVDGVAGQMDALLDTGAQWSIFGGDIADLLFGRADDEEREITLTSRLGPVRGRLHRVTVSLIADEGSDLVVSSSVLLASEWRGPPVLGYSGFLERFRVAIDPGDAPWLFFGSDS